MYLCMRKWKYIFMSSDTTQSHASKRGLFTHTHTQTDMHKQKTERAVGEGEGLRDMQRHFV